MGMRRVLLLALLGLLLALGMAQEGPEVPSPVTESPVTESPVTEAPETAAPSAVAEEKSVVTTAPTPAVVFGDDNLINLHPKQNITTIETFIDPDEDTSPQDAFTLALYMLGSVAVILGLCFLISYGKSLICPSTYGAYTPVYTDSMDDTTHGSTEMTSTRV